MATKHSPAKRRRASKAAPKRVTSKKSTPKTAVETAALKSGAASSTTQPTSLSPRQVKEPKRRLYKRQDKRFRVRPKIPNSFRLTKLSIRLILTNWKVIGGIMLIYAAFTILLVRGLNGGLDVQSLKSQTDGIFRGVGGHLASGFTVYALLLSSSNNVASAEASAYQSFILIMVSLALVWSYRQLLAGLKIRIRDGFYHGMQPLIPVLLVLCVVGLEVLPMVAGIWLYIALVGGNIATTALEQFGTIILTVALCTLSIYLLCSSIFALYIAALPGMTPLKALRSSRELVRYRRWPLIRKLLFLPLVLLLGGVAIMLPVILILPIVAQWLFFGLGTIAIAVIHSYMYVLYRELIRE